MDVMWHYLCLKCGYTTISADPSLETCTAGGVCGGAFRDEDPWAFRWQLVRAGLLSSD